MQVARIVGVVKIIRWLSTLLLGLGALITTPTLQAANTSYYVDCGASSNGSGTQASPWNTLATVNATTFGPGDMILFKRGTTCTGALWPLGSGASGAPITLGAYGNGAKPIISAGTNAYAVKLFNQQYWVISDIETTGGTNHGIYVGGNANTTLNYIRISNVTVHDVTGGDLAARQLGLIVVSSGSGPTKFNDVVIDGAYAYNTTLRAGILIWGVHDTLNPANQATRNTNVTIRNSTVHDVYRDGIIIFGAVGATIENNVVYKSGQEPSLNGVSPNGIWVWACKDCVMQFNESYANNTPVGSDGGGIGVDTVTDNVTVQYNYVHDNERFCIAVYGAESYTTTNAIVRYNICANNGSPDLYILTWDNSSIDGLQIYNNTFYTTHGVLDVGATFVGTRPRFFKNNLVFSTNSNPLGYNLTGIARDYNLYYSLAGSYNSGEAHSIHNTHPLLNSPSYHGVGKPHTQFTVRVGSSALNAGTNVCSGLSGCTMGSRDFFGSTLAQGGSYDIGAYEGTGLNAAGADFLINGDLEAGATIPWTLYSNVSITAANARSGNYALLATTSDTGYEQVIGGLSPNTTYTYRAWLRADSAGNQAYIYAKNFGGSTVRSLYATSVAYTLVSISFTTGATNTSTTVGLWREVGDGSGGFYADDFELLGGSATNLATNGGFESGVANPWTVYGNSSVVATNRHSGSYAMMSPTANTGYEQTVTGLNANTSYVYRAWLKAGANGNRAYLYAKNFGSITVRSSYISDTSYTLVSITFTTGSNATSATIGLWREDTDGSGALYADDFELLK